MKTCSKCGTPKPESEFSKNKTSPDGIHPHCKACRKAAAAARYAANPDHYRKKNQKSYRKRVGPPKPTLPPEEVARRQRVATERWRAANIEHVRARAREYAKKHRHERIAARGLERAVEAGAFAEDVDISKVYQENEDMFGEVACVACGKTASELETGMHVDHLWPFDPDSGVRQGEHVQDNLMVMCPSCNLTKKNGDPVAFLSLSWGLTTS